MEPRPAGAGPLPAARASEPEPPPQRALVRPVGLAEGCCFVVTDEQGQPLVVAPDLPTAHRIARFFGLDPATVH